MSLPGQLLDAMKSASTPAGGSHSLFSGVSLRHRGRAKKSVGADTRAPPEPAPGQEPPPEPRPRRASKAPEPLPLRPPTPPLAHAHSMPAPDSPGTRGDTPLDTVSKNAPPHIAVRYGDAIRLYARSKYVAAADAGGYVGSFELEKRFLASKNPGKQVELVCVPPVLEAGAAGFRASSYTILSNAGLGVGTPVSYGDVVVLVDERGRVWNNKMGVGPSTKHGYLSPREPNTPGEMHVSLFQLPGDDDDDSRSSESSDEEDNFVFFSSLAKTTRTVAETTFGKPTQAEVTLATAALRTVGKVVYYGDRNVVIDVADSNRVRSKFNRVITHYSKGEQHVVQGGFLRCDGRGKPILFELHGADLPTVTSIDMSARSGFRLNAPTVVATAAPALIPGVPLEVDRGSGLQSTRQAIKSMMLPSKSHNDAPTATIAVGQPVLFTGVQQSMVITVRFSDGGCVIVPCNRLRKNEGTPFSRAVLSCIRPLRVTLRASRPSRGAIPRSVDLRGTLRGTYRQIAKLSCVVIVAYVCAAYACSHVLGSVVMLPALYVGLIAGAIVFVVEAFFPGKIVAVRQVQPSDGALDASDSAATGSDDDEAMGDWQMTVLSIEASESERCAAPDAASDAPAVGSGSRRSLRVPKSFLMAEGGDVAKATARYELTLAWRREVQADASLSTPQRFYDVIKANYTQYLHKHDKLGHPVYYEKIGKINMKALQKSGVTSDDLFRHYLFAMEFTVKYAAYECCQCTACAASDTQKMCIVLDTRGMGMRDMGGESFEFIRRCTGVMQRHYPQRSFKIFFVNVPSWFGMAWKGVKPLLNEATRAKTSIVTESDTPAALLECIDADDLPVEYGGRCACPGGCEHGSTYQKLQRMLVESVKDDGAAPFEPSELMDAIAAERAQSRGHEPAPRKRVDATSVWPSTPPAPSAPMRLKRFNSSPAPASVETSLDSRAAAPPAETERELDMLDGEACGALPRPLPAGLFRAEVLLAGYLLKRSVRHKQFNPIWHRQLFILHPDALRFAKTLDSEIFQIVSLTSDTLVRRSLKQNSSSHSFEVVTPPMAANGHSLRLYAPTPQASAAWVDALLEAIERLGGPSSTSSSTASASATAATTAATTAGAAAAVAALAAAAGVASSAHSAASERSRSQSPEHSAHSHDPSPPRSSE